MRSGGDGRQPSCLGTAKACSRQFALAFWPDARGITRRSLSGLIKEADPVVDDADACSEVSAAARGLLALGSLLFDPALAEGPDRPVAAR